MKKYTIGMDFGTLSARAVIADTENGGLLCESRIFEYPHGVITNIGGKELPGGYALQHPEDYIKALEFLLCDTSEKLRELGISSDSVVGIGIDFTACTVLPVDGDGVPLCMKEGFADRPHAYAKLWKHHGAEKYLSVIEKAAEQYGGSMLDCSGGMMSSEFMIPKLYEVYCEDREVYDSAKGFMNAGDFAASVLSGGGYVHSRAYAVIKEHYDEKCGGYPPREFFAALGEGFADVMEKKLGSHLNFAGEGVGRLSREWAGKTGLAEGIAIATPLIDAQSSLAAAGLFDGSVLLVVGTSAVMAVNSSAECEISGILSRGRGSAVPSLTTFESGLAAMGDLYDWFIKNCMPAEYKKRASELGVGDHAYLRSLASKKRVGENRLIALDWWNGNRSVIKDDSLSGLIVGLRLSTRPEDIYRALLESTAFGLRRVCENYEEQGICIEQITVTGGISHKDELLMQILADVLGKPLGVLSSLQSAALGASVYGAVAAGEYPDIISASAAMQCGICKEYLPIEDNKTAYDRIYKLYLKLYNGFGHSDIMREIGEL